MFKLLYQWIYFRKNLPENWTEKTKNSIILKKDIEYLKAVTLILLLFLFFVTLPVSIGYLFFLCIFEIIEASVIDSILIEVEFIAIIWAQVWFMTKFRDEIENFYSLIWTKWYFSRYTISGNAVSGEDWEKLKEEEQDLYDGMKTLYWLGRCYECCFRMLKCLQKGEMKFVVIPTLKADEVKQSGTMHAIYVQNGWCFDTSSFKQYPLQQFMKEIVMKEWKTFNYEDIQNRELDRWMMEICPEIEEWCMQNDCYFFTLPKQS